MKPKKYSKAYAEFDDDHFRAMSLRCRFCDADCNDDLLQAQRVGWSNIVYDPTGLSWNFLGDCLDCQGEELDRLIRICAENKRLWIKFKANVAKGMRFDGTPYPKQRPSGMVDATQGKPRSSKKVTPKKKTKGKQ